MMVSQERRLKVGPCMVVSQERGLKVAPVWWSPRRAD